jgi:hypothetical protein
MDKEKEIEIKNKIKNLRNYISSQYCDDLSEIRFVQMQIKKLEMLLESK